MKTPFVHFIKETIKTFTNKTITTFMMILFIKIILFKQKMNEWTINMCSHNLKPNQYETKPIFNTKILFVFIYHTIKYTPQNRLIWKFLLIIREASFWIKKVTILLQFSKNIWHFLTNSALITSTRTKRISIFNHTFLVLS